MANKLRKALTNTTMTENGAVSNKSTLNPVLDFFYHAAARRGKDNTQLFAEAFQHNQNDAILTAFYVRDVRGGQGERATFRQVLQYLADKNPDLFTRIMPLVPEYGRWDDVLAFVNHGNVGAAVIDFISAQLTVDIDSESPSLLAKWMPSENASAKRSIAMARYLAGMLGITARQYRVMLSDLRSRLKVIETYMSAGKFDAIEYAHVPSRAAMIYRKAFHKRDGERYRAYLAALEKGTTKINSGTLYPYELVNKVRTMNDRTIDAQWNALPDYTNGRTFITVCDTSGSMDVTIPGANVRAMDVAISVALYGADKCKGAFEKMFITFSESPTIQEIKGATLHEKVSNLERTAWGYNTNLQKVMDLLLTTATKHKVSQNDMPESLVIVSDMQFDAASKGRTNLEEIRIKFARAGYTMPTIVFWNVMSRKNETPATESDNGVYLVSGFSPSVFKFVLTGKATNPVELMNEIIHGERYARIAQALKENKE